MIISFILRGHFLLNSRKSRALHLRLRLHTLLHDELDERDFLSLLESQSETEFILNLENLKWIKLSLQPACEWDAEVGIALGKPREHDCILKLDAFFILPVRWWNGIW